MPNQNDVDQFDELFSEIMADGDVKVAEVAEEPAVVPSLESSRETLIQSLVAEPVVETPKPDQAKKERVEYKTVDKVEVEGSPLGTKVYPLGYLTITIPGFRFQNKACFYRAEFAEFVAFLRDAAKSDPWLSALDAAGFRDRGQPRKEG